MARQFAYDTVPAITVTGGKIHGYQLDGTFIFKGVPYAEAQRFHLPVPPTPWDGIRETASYGYVCPMLQQDTPTNELLAPHRYWPQDENCLNLNIWTQTLDASAKKPVMIWIHGGAFSAGSSIEQKVYNGENMSKFGDCVVVSVNHRLNILGYFDLSDYGEAYADSANLGQEDLIAALHWVQDNIRSFGGDPQNVTLIGQSGGGMKISCLLQMPAADGLFHKAVIMSGEAGDYMPYSDASAKPIVEGLLNELGINKVQDLETVPYRELAAAYNKISMPLAMSGNYIGCTPKANQFFKGSGPKVGFRKEATKVPLIVGTTYGEFMPNPFPVGKSDVSDEMLRAGLDQRFGKARESICNAYQKAYPEKNPADLMMMDMIFRGPSRDLIKAFAQSGGQVYSYVFALEFPFHDHQIAWHCSDIPFIFHNTELSPVANMGEVSDRLEAQIFGSLMQFARTGVPGCESLPVWPSSSVDDEATMIFDETCNLRHNFDHEVLQMMEEAIPKFDLIQAIMEMAQNAVH